MSTDYPGIAFVQAEGFTAGRPDGPPLWIVWHDMEVDELPDRAENTAAYFANPTDGRQVSAHYCVDNNSAVQCVREQDVAWTVGNRPGNNRGVNFELAGRARQTRAQWLDPYGLAMFNIAAPIAAHSMTRWSIPNRWCTVADLRARRAGHTTHNDLRVAFGGTTHTDPGPNFPHDHVLAVVDAALKGGAVTTPKTLEEKVDQILAWINYSGETMSWRWDAVAWEQLAVRGGPEGPGADHPGAALPFVQHWVDLLARVDQLARDVAALQQRPQVEAAPVDPLALQAVLASPAVAAAIGRAVLATLAGAITTPPAPAPETVAAAQGDG